MTWHEAGAELSRQRRASAVVGVQANEESGVNRRGTKGTVVDESMKETAERVARHQADYYAGTIVNRTKYCE